MKRAVWIAMCLAIVGCEEKGDGDGPAKAEIPTKSDIKDEVSSGVKDELSNKGPKWKVEYKGDINGKVEGGILTAMSVASNLTAVGKAMKPDKTGSAPQTLSLKITNATSDKPNPMMSLTLADGTKCKQDLENGPPKLKLHDAERKTFHAEVEGAMLCGDKKMTYTAVLKK